MTIPFRIKLLTDTAKAPTQENLGDLFDLYADDFCKQYIKDPIDQTQSILSKEDNSCELLQGGRILVKTGISIELPILNQYKMWYFDSVPEVIPTIEAYAVADIRPRSGLALKYGITVLNTPGTIDNSYRQEIGVILINNGSKRYAIHRGDKIAQILIRPLHPAKMEVVSKMESTERGGFGSTGK